MEMAERTLIMLVNMSFQLVLIFLLVQLGTSIFRIRSASAKRIMWLAAALCPLLLVPMNFMSLDRSLFNTEFVGDLLHPDMPGSISNRTKAQPVASTRIVDTPAIAEPVRELPKEAKPIEPKIRQDEVRKAPHSQPSKAARYSLTSILLIGWILGSGLGLVLIFAGYMRLRKIIMKARMIEDEAALEMLHQIKEDVGLSCNVRLYISDKARAPFSAGFIRPYIVLPDLTFDSHSKMRIVLAHEAIHLKQLDYPANLLCRIIGCFMFFHPLFYLIVRKFRLSSEEVCDRWAIGLTGDKEEYANCLMNLSRTCVGRLPIGFGRSGNSVARRIKSILKNREEFRMISKRRVAFLSVTLFVLILAASAMRLVNPALAEYPFTDPGVGSSPAGGGYLRFPKIEGHRPVGEKSIGLVDLPPEAFLGIDGITIEGWIYFEELPANNQMFMLFQKPEGFQLSVRGIKDHGSIRFEEQSRWKQRDGNHSGGGGGGENFDLEINTWYYFYHQYEAKYEDLHDHVNLPLAIGAKCFHFDLRENRGAFPDFRLITEYIQFVGGIDEVRISNTMRYPAALKDTFAGNAPPDRGLVEIPKKPFKPDANTVALWHFDKGDNFFVDSANGLVIRPYGWLDPQKKRPKPPPEREPPEDSGQDEAEAEEKSDDNEEVKFADQNLEAVIRKQIRKSEGAINKGDCRKMMPMLDAGDKKISNLSGIENCNIKFFMNLSENEIADISPLAGLKELEHLMLMENKIVDLALLSGLTSLTSLNLYENKIVDIRPLAGLARLDDLGLGNNEIVDIKPLAGLPNLKSIVLAGNKISDISPLVNNPGIGKRDKIMLHGNPLNDKAYDVHIPELQKRGVQVFFDPKE